MKHRPFLCPYAIIFPVIFLAGLAGYLLKQAACPVAPVQADQTPIPRATDAQGLKPVLNSEDEWQRTLTPAQYQVCRVGDDEPAFAGNLHDMHQAGTYHCVACGQCVFDAKQKEETGTGWPCFSAPATTVCLDTRPCSESSKGDDVRCQRCGSHLGRLLHDGSSTIYRMNSLALEFRPSRNAPQE